jgi:hypothetical protein
MELLAAVFDGYIVPLAGAVRDQLPYPQPIILYCLFLAWLYFFYAPFRDVSVRERNDDFYAQTVKLLHAWSSVHIILFHILPWYLQHLQHARTAGSAGIVFVILVTTFISFIRLWHWAKRRVHLTITYGTTTMQTLLNAVSVSILLTVQHITCTGVQEAIDNGELKPNLAIVAFCPHFGRSQYEAVAYLVLYGVAFFLLDYGYKVWWGSDPVRGFFSGSQFEPREEEVDARKEARRLRKFNVSGDCSRRASEKRPHGDSMVSWYSLLAAHTAFRTVLGTAMSLGRFDYRTMEPDQGPKTFKVVDSRQEDEEVWRREGYWFDFVADVGDGFNSTYAIAHAMAQPMLYIGEDQIGPRERARRLAQAVKHRFWSPPSPTAQPRTPATPAKPMFEKDFLPRGSLMLIGGDLAYPMPSMESYFKRFYMVYNDALPFDDEVQLPSKKPRPVMIEGNDRTEVDVNPAERPAMFIIPGNHDWIDNLETFRSTVLTFDRLGGWRVPQVTSYFVIQLPYDWWLYCLDTGMGTDIDQLQLQYFLQYTKALPDSASVVLVCHDPHWIHDALYQTPEDPHTQSRVATIAEALGDRMRMRVCGDIHNYTRYEYDDAPTKEHRPIYVVSGGGGAFVHATYQPGQRLTIYGEEHDRAACYPPPKKRYAWRWILRFRLANWKFDIMGSLVYCFIVLPLLPVTNFNDARVNKTSDADKALSLEGVYVFWGKVFNDTSDFFVSYWTDSALTFFIAAGLCFMFYNETDKVISMWRRVLYGGVHGLVHLVVALFLLSLFSNTFESAVALGMTQSTKHDWRPATLEFFTTPINMMTEACGAPCIAVLNTTAARVVKRVASTAVGSLDVMEGLAYYHSAVSPDAPIEPGLFSSAPVPTIAGSGLGFKTWALYYLHFVYFFWLLAAPAVGFVIGCYLCLCVTFLDCSMEHAFAAFMIEDWKHFLRIRIDPKTRNLRVYVVGIETVAKQWQRCPLHEDEKEDHPTRKSHEMHHPSIWAPASRHTRPRVIDEFEVEPRDMTVKPAPTESAGKNS